MRNKKLNWYGLAKDILTLDMRLDNWWKEEFDFQQLRHDFGLGALRNGVQFSIDNGEIVPQEIKDLVEI